MKVTKKLDSGTMTIYVEGWLDTLTAEQFHADVREFEGANNVILDLNGVDYISSAGLREVVALHRSVTGSGGSFSVRGVVPAVMDVFTLTGFDKKLDITPA